MRETLLFILALMFWFPSGLQAQNENLTASNLPEFLAHYEQSLRPVDEAYDELTNENLPLRDEGGKPLARHHIDDRLQTVTNLRQTVHQLVANPQDLVSATTLLVQNEALADDLFDLSQVAFDNDREELGKRLSELEASMDHNKDLIETYALNLAKAKQDRIQELEKENRDLQQKLREATERGKGKPPGR